MSLIGLPQDILTLIAEHLQRKDLLMFASTCKTSARLIGKIESDKCFAAAPLLKSSLLVSRHLSPTSALTRAFPTYFDAMSEAECSPADSTDAKYQSCIEMAALEFIRLRLEHSNRQKTQIQAATTTTPVNDHDFMNRNDSADPSTLASSTERSRLVIGIGDLAATAIHRSYMFLRRENGVHPLCNITLPVVNCWTGTKQVLREAARHRRTELEACSNTSSRISTSSDAYSDVFAELEEDENEQNHNRQLIFDDAGRARYFLTNDEVGTAIPRAICCLPQHSPLLRVQPKNRISDKNVHFPDLLGSHGDQLGSPISAFSTTFNTTASQSSNGLSATNKLLPNAAIPLKDTNNLNLKRAKVHKNAKSSSSSLDQTTDDLDSNYGTNTRVVPRSFSSTSVPTISGGGGGGAQWQPEPMPLQQPSSESRKNPMAEFTPILTPTIPLSFQKESLPAEIRQLFRLFAQLQPKRDKTKTPMSTSEQRSIHVVIDTMCGHDAEKIHQLDKWFHMTVNTIHQLLSIEKPNVCYALLVDVDRLYLDRRYMRRFIRRLQMVGWSENNKAFALINTNPKQLKGALSFQKSMSLLADLRVQALIRPDCLVTYKDYLLKNESLTENSAIKDTRQNFLRFCSFLRPNVMKYYVSLKSNRELESKLFAAASAPNEFTPFSRHHLLNRKSQFTLISCVPLTDQSRPSSPRNPNVSFNQDPNAPENDCFISLCQSDSGACSEEEFDENDSGESHEYESGDDCIESQDPFTDGLTGTWVYETHDSPLAGFVYAFLKTEGLHVCSSNFYEIASAPLFPVSPFATLPPRYSTLPLLMKALMDGSYSSSLSPENEEGENGQGVLSLELEFRGKTGHHMPMIRDVSRYLGCHPFGRMNQRRSILRTVLREPEYTSSFVHHCSSVAERYWHHSVANYVKGFLLETTENEALSCAATLLKTEEVIASQNDGLQIAAALIFREEQELLEEQCLFAAMQLMQRFEEEVETNETIEGVAKLFHTAEQNALDHEKYKNVLLFVNEQEMLRAEKHSLATFRPSLKL